MTQDQGNYVVVGTGVALKAVPINRPETAHRIRRSIERAVHSRIAPQGTAAARVEAVAKSSAERMWAGLKRHPSVGIVAAAGMGFAAVTLVGVGELAFAI